MNTQVAFQQVDVFTDTPFKGNPVAVVLDGNNLSTEKMQAIANWTNLSETTFVCEPINPEADYALRIFTPNNELPFAGHPTLGSAFALLRQGLKPKSVGYLVQESEIGLVHVHIETDKLFFTLPKPNIKPIEQGKLTELAAALGIASEQIIVARTIDVGAVWMTLQLSNADVVRNIQPNMAEIASLTPNGVTGVTVFGSYPKIADVTYEVRSFAPSEGVDEDPVCGSGNGCVAAMVQQLQLLDSKNYVTSQGIAVGRNGQVEVRFKEDGNILIGGKAVTCIEGKINI